jgi:hypothetical protein
MEGFSVIRDPKATGQERKPCSDVPRMTAFPLAIYVAER